MDYIFCAEQIEVPDELPGIMKAWTKEVIRYSPKDPIAFSRQYFEALSKGADHLQDFLADLEASSNPRSTRSNQSRQPAAAASVETGKLSSEKRSDGEATESKKIDAAARKRSIFKAAFDKYDKDGSGTIDTQELSKIMKDLDWNNSDEAMEKAISVLDADRNGTIDLEEFLQWSSYAWKHQAHARQNSISHTKARRDPKDLKTKSITPDAVIEEEETE